MWWYYDLVVIAVLVLCVWNGMRKGVSRSLMQLAATILSAVIAFAISQPLAEFCYTEFLEKPVVSALEQKLNTVDVAGLVQEKLTENGIPVSEEQVQMMLANPDGVAAQYGIDAAWLHEQVDAAAVYVEEVTDGRIAGMAGQSSSIRWGVTVRYCQSGSFWQYQTGSRNTGIAIWETSILYDFADYFICTLLSSPSAVVAGNTCLSSHAADGGVCRYGTWGSSWYFKSLSVALVNGAFNPSNGFSNTGDGCVFHGGMDSKDVFVPVALLNGGYRCIR